MKEYKKPIIYGSLLCLLPILIGVTMYESIPEMVAVHFDINNVADKFMSRAAVVFFIPIFMLVIHCISIYLSLGDNFKNKKLLKIMFWIIPILSNIMMVMVYYTTLKANFELLRVAPQIINVLLIVLANFYNGLKYQNVFGIRVPWAMSDEEIWQRCHHLAAYVWTFAGFANIIMWFILDNYYLVYFICALIIAILIPIAYAFILAKRKGI